ncbi:hypothetical protein BJY52DRAFT_1198851 [Lactarius psammicola]|nr:hypothetical protein BJY52DRAFT_1198851 [Lactarius psammicola]
MEQNNQPPPTPQHVPWSQDPVPPSPSIDPNDMGHLLAHIKTFNKDPIPSQPYRAIMDAGYDPNSQPTSREVVPTPAPIPSNEYTHNYDWLITPLTGTERQGTPQAEFHLPPIAILDDAESTLPPSSIPMVSSVQYTQDSVQEIANPQLQTTNKLSDTTRRYIREAAASLTAIRRAKTPNCLPETTRTLIREAIRNVQFLAPLPDVPEVITIHDSSDVSLAAGSGVMVPPPRPPSAASVWTHVTHESIASQFDMGFFPETRVRDFVKSIDDVLNVPVLVDYVLPNIGSEDFDRDRDGAEDIREELMIAIGRDLSEAQLGYRHFYLRKPIKLARDNSLSCMAEDFNYSVGTVIAALDCGVADNAGELDHTALTPSGWFKTASAVVTAALRGALQSGGNKIKGRVHLGDDEEDEWKLAEGLVPPVTQGGRLATAANQLAEFFAHYAAHEEPPLLEFYHEALKVAQNHIEKAVRLKAAAAYQATTADVEGLTKMVLDDMARSLYSHFESRPETRRMVCHKVLDRIVRDAEQDVAPYIENWRKLYLHELTEALKDNEDDREETPLTGHPLLDENAGYVKLSAYRRVNAIRESIARLVTDPLLDGDEVTRARERIRIEHAEEIEAARTETRAQISTEKKAWATAYRDSNKLTFLTKAAEELGYVLVSKDDAEERKGQLVKHRASPDGKRDRSSSRAGISTPIEVPVTPVNRPCKLDLSKTPTARKTKGKCSLVIPKAIRSRSQSFSLAGSQADEDATMADAVDVIPPPQFFATAYPETKARLDAFISSTAPISGITVPADVRASQAPSAPLRNPLRDISEPLTDVSIEADREPLFLPVPSDDVFITPTDQSRGTSSSIHNPANAMVDDPSPETADPVPAVLVKERPDAPVPPPPCPIPTIPLMPGLAEMLTALQSNLMTSFTNQIATLSRRIDGQDAVITSINARPPQGPAPTNPGLSGPGIPIHDTTPPLPVEGLGASLPAPTQEGAPIPIPPPINRATRPAQRAILPEGSTARSNANAIGRTAGGAAQKGGKGSPPLSTDNTEITITCGIVQAARSQMECMSAQAPALLYGRWSVNKSSHNFVYVFADVVPFSTVLQFSKALTEPLGGGNPLPNKGWTFAQLRGVPTSDGAGVIHDPDTLLREVRRVPFFTDAIFVSKLNWQLPVTSLAHATRGVVQLAFIDETGTRSHAAKQHGVGIAADATRSGTPPTLPPASLGRTVSNATYAAAPTLVQTTASIVKRQLTLLLVNVTVGTRACFNSTTSTPTAAPVDADGFTTVQRVGRRNIPAAPVPLGEAVGKPSKPSRSTRQRANKKAKAAAANAVVPGHMPTGGDPPSSSIESSSVATVIFPDDVASISATLDAFQLVAATVSDGSPQDMSRALTELELGWGPHTDSLSNLFSTEAFLVKGVEAAEERLARITSFRTNWGSTNPVHFAYSHLPHNTHFATEAEVQARDKEAANTGESTRRIFEAKNFTMDLATSLFENNFINRAITPAEADFIVIMNSLDQYFSLDHPNPNIGDAAADAIKSFLKDDASRLFSIPSTIRHA